jgi:hypothetical protein
MKKRILMLAALAAIVVNAKAQFTKEDGPAMPENEAGKVSKILGGDERYFYTLVENGHGKGQKYFVEQYSVSDFKKGFSTQLPIAQNAQNLESYYAGGHSIFLYCTDEGKKVTSTLYYCTVDAKGNASEGIQLAQAQNRKPERNLWVFPSFYFTVSISPDKNHIAIASRDYGDKGKDLKLTLTVYNTTNMAKEWDRDISEMGGKNFSVDDAGNVFYVSYASETDERDLVIVTKDTPGLTALPISIGTGKEMDGVTIATNGNTITVGGFFEEQAAKKAGVFSQQFDFAARKSIGTDFQYLSDDLVKALFGEEVKKKGVPNMIEVTFGNKYIDIDDVKLIEGSYYFIGKDVEKEYSTREHTTYSTHTTFGMPTSTGRLNTTTTFSEHTSTTHSATYNSDKVIVFKVNASGKTEWVKDISATSRTVVAPLPYLVSSNWTLRPQVLSLVIDNKLVVLHANVKAQGMGLNVSDIAYSAFDANGNVTGEKLCSDGSRCFVFNALGIYAYYNVFYQTGKNIIVYDDRKENQHFSRFTFK